MAMERKAVDLLIVTIACLLDNDYEFGFWH